MLKVSKELSLKRFKLTPLSDYQLHPIFNFNTRPQNGLPMLTHARKAID